MYISKIHTSFKDKKYDKAITLANGALKNLPFFYPYYELKAQALFELGEFATCLEVIGEGLKVKSDSVVLIELNQTINEKVKSTDWFCGKSLFYLKVR